MEIIIDQTTKIFCKAIKRYKKMFPSAEYASILFTLDESGEIVYQVGINHSPELYVTFLQILGVKIDLRGFSFFVPDAIKKILLRFQTQYNNKDIVVTVYASEDEDDEVRYFVFAGGEMQTEFKLADVLEFDLQSANE